MCSIILAQSRTTIYDVQYTTNPSGDSPMVNQSVTLTGIVTANFYSGYIISEGNGPWQSLYIYSQKNGPNVGDEVQVTGTVSEYYNMTEIVNVTAFQVLSTGNPVTPINAVIESHKTEAYESCLLMFQDCSVPQINPSYGEWTVNDGTGTLTANDTNDYMYFAHAGDYLYSVTGILMYSFGEFKLEPRFTLDIDGDMIPHYAIHGTIVTMNTQHDVIEDGYIEILGDIIISISTTPPDGILIVDLDGLIFPGLIDAHNHPRYNVLSEIPFPCTFAERYEWQDHPMYDDFNTQYYGILSPNGQNENSTNIWKLAEVRALTAGTTMIQGFNGYDHSADDVSHSGMIINNVERFPTKSYSSTFPLEHQSDWINNKRNQFWDRFIIHLSEGFSANSLQEFNTWSSWGMLDWRTSIIHGVPLGDTEWQLMADANAHLIWSPFSNWVLYRQTADVPGALAAGVNVALAPDWTESGMDNLLDEMKFANSISQELWDGLLTPTQLADMVTRNAAYAVGVENRLGTLVAGYQANIMAIPASLPDPYSSLLQAEPADVITTIVSGRPMYGDPAIMDQFDFAVPTEDILICGTPKKLAIQIDAPSIPSSNKTIGLVMTILQDAYDQSFPQLCEFISYDPCNGSSSTPTPTPTGGQMTPTPTPTQGSSAPSPTPTQSSCDTLGVEVWMPSNFYRPGDPCSVEVRICNPSAATYHDVPLFVILDVYGNYYFAPTFSSYDKYTLTDVHSGMDTMVILPPFDWPTGAGAADGINWYAGMTNKDLTQLFGTYGFYSFGWGL